MQQYDKYCVPYIRSKFSSDFTSKLGSDKTMKTCNDLFGCGECIEGKREGSYLTQEDCNTFFNRDKQQWRIKPISGKQAYTIENDEYKTCIQAPTTYSGYFVMAKCDGSARQAFDFLELSRSFGDPRIVVRMYGSDKNGTAPGTCLTTERCVGIPVLRVAPPCGFLHVEPNAACAFKRHKPTVRMMTMASSSSRAPAHASTARSSRATTRCR